ncbi:hypothetical protein GF312_01050, partial [Candidatus Poribacteria bacterium]|nr:hypothetical protein [Candidatus Poribacteria bacterium]
MAEILEKISRNAAPILMSEVGAILHDLGKLSSNFLEGHAKDGKMGFEHHLFLKRLTSKRDPLLEENELLKEDGLEKALSQVRDTYIKLEESRKKNPEEIEKNLKSDFEEAKLLKSYKNQMKVEESIPDEFRLLEDQTANLKLINMLSCGFADYLELPWCVNDFFQAKSLGDFIELHHEKTWRPGQIVPWLVWAMISCDGLNTAVDTTHLGSNTDNAKQTMPPYASTPFGYEYKQIKSVIVNEARFSFCEALYNGLKELKSTETNDKNKAIIKFRKKVIKAAEKSFAKSISDTRRTANDSRLLDHVYSVATMSKALIAKYIIELPDKSNEIPPIYKDLRQQAQWHILSLVFDGVGFISKGHKIGDILGRIDIIEDFKKDIKTYLEEKVPIGNEIYKDEYGIHFLIPHLDNKDMQDQLTQEIQLQIKCIYDSKDKYSDMYPQILINPEPTKTLTALGEQIKKARKLLQKPTVSTEASWGDAWKNLPNRSNPDYLQNLKGYLNIQIVCEDICYSSNPNALPRCQYANSESQVYCASIHSEGRDANFAFTPEIDVCPVCQLRPKCEQLELCKSCYDSRKSRVDPWIKKLKKRKSTIWIDEVADSSGKVALVVGHIDLTNWLDGTFVPTTLLQSLKWGLEKKDTSTDNPYKTIRESIEQMADNYNNDQNINDASETYNKFVASRNMSTKEAMTKEFLEHNIISSPDEPVDVDRAIRNIFGKYPTATRLRNIWRTTDDFWKNCQKDILELLKNEVSGDTLRGRRLWLPVEWEGKAPPRLAYKAKIGEFGIPVDVYWHKEDERSGLAVTENLEYINSILKAESLDDLKEKILGEDIELIEKSSVQKSKNPINGVIEIPQFQNEWLGKTEENYDYIPFIPVLSTPVTFMNIVPASQAQAVVEAIKTRYDREFGKVKAHLPVHVMALYFHRHYPLYVAMDSAKRMLKKPEGDRLEDKWEDWTVLDVSEAGNEDEIALEFENGCSWNICYKLGDNSIDQCYTHLFAIKEGLEDKETYIRGLLSDFPDMAAVCGEDLKDLKGAKVKVIPSYFDYEYLDSVGRRFEIGYQNTGEARLRRRGSDPYFGPRPYYMDIYPIIPKLWKALERDQKVEKTHIKHLETMLATAHQLWDGDDPADIAAKIKYIEHTFINVGSREWWRSLAETERDNLIKAALDKTFFDILELKLVLGKSL